MNIKTNLNLNNPATSLSPDLSNPAIDTNGNASTANIGLADVSALSGDVTARDFVAVRDAIVFSSNASDGAIPTPPVIIPSSDGTDLYHEQHPEAPLLPIWLKSRGINGNPVFLEPGANLNFKSEGVIKVAYRMPSIRVVEPRETRFNAPPPPATELTTNSVVTSTSGEGGSMKLLENVADAKSVTATAAAQSFSGVSTEASQHKIDTYSSVSARPSMTEEESKTTPMKVRSSLISKDLAEAEQIKTNSAGARFREENLTLAQNVEAMRQADRELRERDISQKRIEVQEFTQPSPQQEQGRNSNQQNKNGDGSENGQSETQVVLSQKGEKTPIISALPSAAPALISRFNSTEQDKEQDELFVEDEEVEKLKQISNRVRSKEKNKRREED